MKKIAASALLAFVLLGTTGCGTFFVYQQHTAGKNDPNSRGDGVSHKFVSSPAYEVLGPVEAQGESRIILGLVADGNEGYGLLMDSAKSQFGSDATTVLHIIADYDYQGILFPIWGTVATDYYGVAVRLESIEAVENAN